MARGKGTRWGPLSYVFDRAPCAIAEVRRVLRVGGVALFGVMSLWGAVHEGLESVMKIDPDVNRGIVASGDLHPTTYPEREAQHRCHMYRSHELAGLLRAGGFTVEAVAASNCLTALAGTRLDKAYGDPERWAHLLELELEACLQPGCVDMGSHIIAVGRKA